MKQRKELKRLYPFVGANLVVGNEGINPTALLSVVALVVIVGGWITWVSGVGGGASPQAAASVVSSTPLPTDLSFGLGSGLVREIRLTPTSSPVPPTFTPSPVPPTFTPSLTATWTPIVFPTSAYSNTGCHAGDYSFGSVICDAVSVNVPLQPLPGTPTPILFFTITPSPTLPNLLDVPPAPN
jgi:hypothetical protein